MRIQFRAVLTCVLLAVAVVSQAQQKAGAPRKAQVKHGYLSDDGAVVTVGKVPDALKLADFSNHLGVLPPGTKVKIFETRQDPAIPATWTRIEILEGEYEGKTGWALSQTVHVTATPAAAPAAKPTGTQTGKVRTPQTGVTPPANAPAPDQAGAQELPPAGSTHRVRVGTEVFGTPDIFGGKGTRLDAGDWAEKVAERKDAVTSILWLQVRMRSGPQKGKSLWVASHDLLARKRTVSIIIASRSDEKSWQIASELAEHPDVEALDTTRLEALSGEKDLLARADEVIVLEHGRSPDNEIPHVLGSNDDPVSLALKLKQGGMRTGTRVELLVCNAGSEFQSKDGTTTTFATLLAQQLNQPVIAYRHYIRVSARCVFSERPCLSASVSGYVYRANPETGEEVKESPGGPAEVLAGGGF